MMMPMAQVAPTPPTPPAPPTPPGFPAPDVFVQALPPWATLPPSVVLLSLIAICAAAAIVLWPIARALARRLEGRPAQLPDPALAGEVERLHARVAELEERVDFTERMMARQREPERLP